MKTVFFVICASFGFMLLSCGKKCDPLPGESFSKSDYATVPYSGDDTLKFMHNGHDTIILSGHGRVDSARSFTNSSGCTGTIHEWYRSASYISWDNKYNLKIILAKVGSSPSLNFNFLDSSYGAHLYTLTNSSNFVDSILIQKRMYMQVKKIADINKPNIQNRYILYTVKDGVIRIQNGPADVWDIVK